jgi:hypothetical protein
VASESAELIPDLQIFLYESAALEQTEVNLPHAVAGFLQAEVFTDAAAAEVDQVMVPDIQRKPPGEIASFV